MVEHSEKILACEGKDTHTHTLNHGGDGAGFFPACEDFGRMFDNSFSASTFLSFFFLLFKVEINSRALISLFRPGSVHSGSES